MTIAATIATAEEVIQIATDIYAEVTKIVHGMGAGKLTPDEAMKALAAYQTKAAANRASEQAEIDAYAAQQKAGAPTE